MSDLNDEILENAQGPKKATGDSGSMENHSLLDQIAADKYLASRSATSDGYVRGLRLNRIKPPGTV